mgnify:CR=1 FL=1
MTTTSTRRRTRKSPAKKAAPAASKAVLNTTTVVEAKPTVTETPKVEAPPTPKVEATAPAVNKVPTASLADLTKLRGFDFVVLPLIYLEAFVVNIVQNAGFKVPDRVAVQ